MHTTTPALPDAGWFGLDFDPSPPSYSVGFEGRRWVLRLDGRLVFTTPSEASARDQMARRSSDGTRPVKGYGDVDQLRAFGYLRSPLPSPPV